MPELIIGVTSAIIGALMAWALTRRSQIADLHRRRERLFEDVVNRVSRVDDRLKVLETATTIGNDRLSILVQSYDTLVENLQGAGIPVQKRWPGWRRGDDH